MGVGRMLFRAFYGTDRVRSKIIATPAIVYGAADAGVQVAKLIDTAEEPP